MLNDKIFENFDENALSSCGRWKNFILYKKEIIKLLIAVLIVSNMTLGLALFNNMLHIYYLLLYQTELSRLETLGISTS